MWGNSQRGGAVPFNREASPKEQQAQRVRRRQAPWMRLHGGAWRRKEELQTRRMRLYGGAWVLVNLPNT